MSTKRLYLDKTVLLTRYPGSTLLGSGADEVLAAGTLFSSAPDRLRRWIAWVPGGIPAGWHDEMGAISDIRYWARGTETGVNRVDAYSPTSTRHKVRRMSAVPSGGEGTNTSASSGAPTKWGDESTETANEGELVTPVLGDVRGKWKSWTVKGIAIWHAPTRLSGKASVKSQAIFGFVIGRNDDDFSMAGNLSGAVGNGEYWSEDKGSAYQHYIEWTFDTNTAPRAPIITSLRTLENGDPVLVASPSGTTATVNWAQDDPDAGDWTRLRQHNLHNDANAFLRAVAIESVGTPRSGADVLLSLPARSILRVGSRTQDNSLAYSPFTALTAGRFKTAYKPGKPSGVYVQTTPNNPHIYASLVSQDPLDFLTRARVVIDYFPGAGAVINVLDDTVTIGGASSNRLDYASSLTLDPAKEYRLQVTLYNRDGIDSPPSDYYRWTPAAESGPALMIPMDQGVKLLSRNGPLTVGHLTDFDRLQWTLYRAGAPVHVSAVLTVDGVLSAGFYRVTFDIPDGLVEWGERDLGYIAAVRPVGNADLDPPSPLRPLRINALPDRPVGTVTA